MPHPTVDRLPYTLDKIVHRVPPTSGVFAFFARTECVFVGASDDVCASLPQTSYEDTPDLGAKDLTHFASDFVAPEGRAARRSEAGCAS